MRWEITRRKRPIAVDAPASVNVNHCKLPCNNPTVGEGCTNPDDDGDPSDGTGTFTHNVVTVAIA